MKSKTKKEKNISSNNKLIKRMCFTNCKQNVDVAEYNSASMIFQFKSKKDAKLFYYSLRRMVRYLTEPGEFERQNNLVHILGFGKSKNCVLIKKGCGYFLIKANNDSLLFRNHFFRLGYITIEFTVINEIGEIILECIDK
jgi:hypothetical protein